MSSLRNIVPRRTYKERAQPASRERSGILEKHKDYVIRAKAFHKKQETIRKLREKASNRNPDEFNFKMIRSRLVDGVHKKNQDIIHSVTQNNEMKPILQKIDATKKKIKKLKTSIDSQTIFYTERKINGSNKQLKESKTRLKELENICVDKTLQMETQNISKKRKLVKNANLSKANYIRARKH
ncbi:probable U3 small nucleolar RNA-associated protein 11 [Vicia villosa]|uniref:probable U3 small nucleolar RNA-associated protein 11 n=1 Tax=Vicia villosa TaxID=3911 RepID=UPI00273AA0DC|nr:probable U3 small nucleolar RNA-associated protein 11 [Vicia villosa]